MKNLRYLVFIAIILQCPIYSLGQFSRQQAEDLVLNKVLVDDTGHIDVYCSYTTIQDTNKIISADGQTISPTYQDNWVFFSDDHPRANWYHPCRYIFVNSNTGEFQINASLAFPIDIESDYQPLLATYPCPATCQNNSTITPPRIPHILPTSTNSHLHAVLINGIDRSVGNGWGSCTCNFDYDIAIMYNALEEIGYTTHYNPPPSGNTPNESNVIVLYDNGNSTNAGKTIFHNDWDGPCECIPPPYTSSCTACTTYRNEVDGSASYAKIIEIFDNLSVGGVRELKPEDQLFVYITGNGTIYDGQQAFECYHPVGTTPVYMTATQLRDAVKNITCAQIVFVLQQNYSGGFKDLLTDIADAKCKNRLVITATSDVNSSYKELWTHCGNIDEFTYYFAAALRGHYEGRFPWEWSYPVGEFPFNNTNNGINWHADGCDIYNPPNSNPHPTDYNPDSGNSPYPNIEKGNNDGYTQFIEAFNYAKCMDTWCQDGYLNQRKIMVVQDPNAPNPPPYTWITFNTNVSCNFDLETPLMKASDGFGLSKLMCLNGIAGTLPSSSSPQIDEGRSFLLGGNLNIHSSSNMNVPKNVEFTIGVDNANIDVDQSSTFRVGSGFIFKGRSSNTNWLNILNLNNTLDLEHVTFSSVNLMNYGTLNIGLVATTPYPTFNNCYTIASEGDVQIEYSNFYNSSVYLGDDPSSSHFAIVDHCNFNSTTAIDNLGLTHLKNYSITNNVFNGGLYGIGLYYDGSTSGNKLVQNNQISNCTEGGIYIYGSDASINMNHIYNNLNGIEILNNNSNVSMAGNPNAQNYSQTQEINDCTGLEIYATNNCLPYYMKYNAIIDEHRVPPDPSSLLYYDNIPNPGLPFPKYDVSQNCWGQNFVPSNDLKLNYGLFLPYPTWCPSNNIIPIGQDEAMYNTAINDIDSSNYTEAMNLFKLLVETYPKSEYAKASMKSMLETESYTGNDFSDLKAFYLTNDSILADSSLAQLGDFLANSCDVQMQNYASAISWYENRIQNSADPNDSIFAIIDLGHLYTIMDTTGTKSIFIGSMPQYKPKSNAKYKAYRDSLIFLLPFAKDPLKKSLIKLQNGQLLQNVPNPSNSSTDFYFRLFSATSADIKIFDISGQLKQIIPIKNLSAGIQKLTFNTSNLSSGIYEYVLTIDGKRTDTKKLVVIK